MDRRETVDLNVSNDARPMSLGKPVTLSIVAVIIFGLVVQLLLVLEANMTRRLFSDGLSPMQELLVIRRQVETATQIVKASHQHAPLGCEQQESDLCQVPQMLRNVEASAQRLMQGRAGPAGLPGSRPLDGTVRQQADQLRSQAAQLVDTTVQALKGSRASLLLLEGGLLKIKEHLDFLEGAMLARLQELNRFRFWVESSIIGATGLLLMLTVFILFWMWRRLRVAFAGRQDREERLKAYAQASPDPAYVIRHDGLVLEVLGREDESMRRPNAILRGDRVQDKRNPSQTNEILSVIRRTLETKEVQAYRSSLQSADGHTTYWYDARVAPLPRSRLLDDATTLAIDDGSERVIWVSRDITHLHQQEVELRALNEKLENRVAERTEALNDAAEELRRFNYTVSHDLRAPLRAIEAFTSLAMEEGAATMPSAAKDMLERARKAAHQLSHMVESLLNLSRISELPIAPSRLNLSAMANETCSVLTTQRADGNVSYRVASGLQAYGDPHLVRSLLQNLIGNAIKYSSQKDVSEIEIGQSAGSDGHAAIYVKDNGVGFDMARAAQLFMPFTRLHHDGVHGGEGIGLATAKRIVHRHGGRIWAQSVVGEGSTFFFTLPDPETTTR